MMADAGLGLVGGTSMGVIFAGTGIKVEGGGAVAGVVPVMSSRTSAAESSADGGFPCALNSAQLLGLSSSMKCTSLAKSQHLQVCSPLFH